MGWLIGEYWPGNDMDQSMPLEKYDDQGNGDWNWVDPTNSVMYMQTPSGKRLIRPRDLIIYDPDKKKFFRDLDYLELYKEKEL